MKWSTCTACQWDWSVGRHFKSTNVKRDIAKAPGQNGCNNGRILIHRAELVDWLISGNKILTRLGLIQIPLHGDRSN
eukprot:scaffold257193_cov20-Prasinocladus_malaysianus.AAC.1